MDVLDEKTVVRKAAYARRADVTNAIQVGNMAIERLTSMAPFKNSTTQLWYVSCRSELRTQHFIKRILTNTESFDDQNTKNATEIIVPFCTKVEGQNQLDLFRIKSFDELKPGTWHILEPSSSVRSQSHRLVAPGKIDVAIIPGVAFDKSGNRLGNGAGYYDWLLSQMIPSTTRIALAYSTQIVDKVPTLPHDQKVDFIVTESEIIHCQNA